jgi:hypothetical protein
LFAWLVHLGIKTRLIQLFQVDVLALQAFFAIFVVVFLSPLLACTPQVPKKIKKEIKKRFCDPTFSIPKITQVPQKKKRKKKRFHDRTFSIPKFLE